MLAIASVARTGLDASVRHPLRSAAAIACIASVLTPFVAGLGISRGLADEAAASIALGADLHVTGERFGRSVPIPLAAADEVRVVPGVTEVVPRIVAAIHLGRDGDNAVLVGLPARRFPPAISCVEGRLPTAGEANELAVGSQLARRLGLKVGSVIPPFYRNDAEGERVSTVVGVFRSDLPIWAANLVLADIDTAARISDARGLVSGLLVSCPAEYQDAVAAKIAELDSLAPGDPEGPIRARVMTREDAAAFVPEGVLARESIFNLHFVLAFALGIPLLLVTSGVGLAERRRETGLLKALGWHSDEILVRGLAESALLAVLGASIAVLLAFAWLVPLNGWGIAGVFLAGPDLAPGFAVPFRLAPEPILLAYVISFVVTATGTLLSTWRAATAPPMEAMR
jgi:ABC-type lipoprotein release transport system permease subunit